MSSVSAGRPLQILAEAKRWIPHGWYKITALGRSPYTATEQFHYRLIREVLHSNPQISGEENKEKGYRCDVYNSLYLINCSNVKISKYNKIKTNTCGSSYTATRKFEDCI